MAQFVHNSLCVYNNTCTISVCDLSGCVWYENISLTVKTKHICILCSTKYRVNEIFHNGGKNMNLQSWKQELYSAELLYSINNK